MNRKIYFFLLGDFKSKPLEDAATNGRLDIVKLLLEDPRVDPSLNFSLANACDGTSPTLPLHYHHEQSSPLFKNLFCCASVGPDCLILGGFEEIVELLLADGRVDPSVHDNLAIRQASIQGRGKIVEVSPSSSPLWCSARHMEENSRGYVLLDLSYLCLLISCC